MKSTSLKIAVQTTQIKKVLTLGSFDVGVMHLADKFFMANTRLLSAKGHHVDDNLISFSRNKNNLKSKLALPCNSVNTC